MQRPAHSMMKPARGRPQDLAHAALRVAQAVMPDPAHPQRAPLPLLPLARAFSLQATAHQLATNRAAQWLNLGTALPAAALDARTASEGLALASAATQAWLSWQARWLEGLTELATQMCEVRQANTLSKLVDQELDTVQQALALAGAQASAAMQLAENLNISLAWWVQQRAEAARTP